MKKIFVFVLTLVLTAACLIGCNNDGQKTPEPTNMDVMYIYVTAVGDDWIYGNDTKVFCGKDHGYNVDETVTVEYLKTDVVEESGTVSVNQMGTSNEYTYSKIIKKVLYSGIFKISNTNIGGLICYKPVIYLYPEKTTDVFVKLDLNGRFTETIPDYRDGWHVVASPDGQLLADDGKTYPYLFWEGIPNVKFTITEGFCVEGSQTRAFFEEILPEIGLTENEYTEFIEYWLPKMENNEYNIIQFQGETYLNAAKLEINPMPDSVLRVFMTYSESDEYICLKEQTFTPFVRTGFTVVEWGGTCLD